ncbi:MAG: hypothetical protein HQM15_07990 [Deltaproteobacteria bacterium]|nr:hypothetical protein [Deltaproteobacteria bacterium]
MSLLFFSLFFFSPNTAESQEIHEIPRRVLIFYDTAQTQDPFFNSFHQQAEVWLNHLGLQAYYWRSDWPLPSPAHMEGVRGIVTWFKRAKVFAEPAAYCHWIKDQMQQGRKWIIWEELGFAEQGPKPLATECVEALQELGLQYGGEFSDNTYFWELLKKNPEWAEFERPLKLTDSLTYNLFKPVRRDLNVYLSIQRRDLEQSESVMIMTSPKGGFVQNSYVRAVSPDQTQIQWRLNPYLFFNEALQMQGLPRPDVTTQNGKRLFLSNIDGDGIFNASQKKENAYSGEVILEDILKKYPQLPISTSLIVGYLDLLSYQTPRIQELYKNILSLPNTEVVAHAYSHPLVWDKGKLSLEVPHYQFDPVQEVSRAQSRLDGYLQQNHISKKVSLFSWSGNSLPQENALKTTYDLGLKNINGGMTRFDALHKSYAYLYPLGIFRGPYLQVYSPSSNENVYTNLWQGPFYGFRDLRLLWDRSENPIRLKPLMLYYHYYSGERLASLKVLQELYEDALSQEPFPLFTSEYVAEVQDFFSTQLKQVSASSFEINTQGALKTIRFDHEKRNIDLKQSKGILGFGHFQDNLYVWLNEDLNHLLVLDAKEQALPYLLDSNAKIKSFRATSSQIEFDAQGWLSPKIRLAGLEKNKKFILEEEHETRPVESDGQGQVTLALTNNIQNRFVHVRLLPQTF